MPLQRLDLTPTAHPLGEAIGSGLEALAGQKMQQLQRNYQSQSTARGLEALGFNPQQAMAYAHLDPSLLNLVVKQRLEEPSRQAFAQGLQAILGGGITHPEQQIEYQQQIPQQFTEGEMLGQKIFGTPVLMQQIPTSVQPRMQQTPSLRSLGALNPQQALQLAQLGLQKQAVAQKEASAQKKFEQQLTAKQQAQADKETLPYYTKILEEDKAAKKTDLDTARMIKLIEKGKLPDPVYYKQLKDLEESVTPFKAISAGAASGAGIGTVLGGIPGAAAGTLIGSLLGLGAALKPTRELGKIRKEFPDTEEFEKLSAGFISGAKAVFGARITDQDLRAFMLTVPQLSNTDEGKKAIIRNIQIINKATHVRANALKKIIRENGGHRPPDIAIRVEEIAAPELDKLADEFVAGPMKAQI